MTLKSGDQCYSVRLPSVQRRGSLRPDSFYLTLKITIMLHNKHLQLKNWLFLGSENFYMRACF